MQVPGTKTSSISSMEDLSDSFPKRPNNGFGVDLLGGNSVSSQHRYNSSTHDSYSYPASAVTTSSANTFLHPTPNNNLLHPRNSSDSSANGFQGTQAHTSGYMHMTRRDVVGGYIIFCLSYLLFVSKYIGCVLLAVGGEH